MSERTGSRETEIQPIKSEHTAWQSSPKPFKSVFIAAPLSTFDVSISCGDNIPIEERDPDEVRLINGTQIAPQEVPVFNPAFDITPHDLISGIITEKGIITDRFEEEIEALFSAEALT